VLPIKEPNQGRSQTAVHDGALLYWSARLSKLPAHTAWSI
jgi:hypothetical protein